MRYSHSQQLRIDAGVEQPAEPAPSRIASIVNATERREFIAMANKLFPGLNVRESEDDSRTVVCDSCGCREGWNQSHIGAFWWGWIEGRWFGASLVGGHV